MDQLISSIDLENAAAEFPGARIAAVVSGPHPKWEERPLLVIECHSGETVSEVEILTHMKARVARWWLPDIIIFAEVPLTATGKIDKKILRHQYEDIFLNRS